MIRFFAANDGEGFSQLLAAARRRLWIVFPFVTRDAVVRLLSASRLPEDLRLNHASQQAPTSVVELSIVAIADDAIWSSG